MRYQVGEKLLTIAFVYGDRTPTPMAPFIMGTPAPDQMILIELEVKEHHKVPSEYGEPDELNCDGYILMDKDGDIWHNQYPRASYGQISDEGDRRFWRQRDSMEAYQELDKQKVAVETLLLSEFYRNVKRGIEAHTNPFDPIDNPAPNRNWEPDPVLGKQLTDLITVLDKQVADEFKVKFVPRNIGVGSKIVRWVTEPL